jgi:pimeloyl-ACP methyl ester carboxylesterase
MTAALLAPTEMAIAWSPLRRFSAWTLATPLSIVNPLFGLRPVRRRGRRTIELATPQLHRHTCAVGTPAELGEMPSRYKDLTVLVGILYGTGDRILDRVVHGKGLAAKVTGADLELIEGGGHMIILITPADRAGAFIDRMAQRAAAAESKLASVKHGPKMNAALSRG